MRIFFFFWSHSHVFGFCNHRLGHGASIFTASGAAARKFQNEVEAGLVRNIFFCHVANNIFI